MLQRNNAATVIRVSFAEKLELELSICDPPNQRKQIGNVNLTKLPEGVLVKACFTMIKDTVYQPKNQDKSRPQDQQMFFAKR
ncbi:MAG: hypothetical protein KF881_03260 [Acidobacteria bacterium]|nr:hypothetical protein [Acidobacteriota bacterium]